MSEPEEKDGRMVEMILGRVVIRDGSTQQHIHLRERTGERSFPIIIGTPEAAEIQRVLTSTQTERPLTHQLTHDSILALGARLARVDIVDLRSNTFFAQLVLHGEDGDLRAVVDARPSDAVALALRAGCPMRVAESVLEQVRTDRARDALKEAEQGEQPVEEGQEGSGGAKQQDEESEGGRDEADQGQEESEDEGGDAEQVDEE
jgi:bifunctional DNase/RNase